MRKFEIAGQDSLLDARRCTSCGQVLPATREFYSKKLNGLDTRCKTCLRIKCREYRQKNRDKLIIKDRLKYLARRDSDLPRRRQYYLTHKRQTIESNTARWHKRHATEPAFRILCNLRSRMNGLLRNGLKSANTIALVGCSAQELKRHLESLFESGMSWENYGFRGWHIDHIVPCAFFDMNNPEEQRRCFHYTNLQPLWAEENIKKNAGGRTHEEIQLRRANNNGR